MGRSPDTFRRSLGAFCLAAAMLMLTLGLTIRKERLQGELFVYYWLVCTVFTGLTMLIALLDLRAVRQRSREEESELVKDVLREFAPGNEEANED